MSKTASEVRQFKLRALTRTAPELLDLSIRELHSLSANLARTIDNCGPFDPATETLIRQKQLYDRLAFLKDAERRGLDAWREDKLSRYITTLGPDILGLSAEEALNLAEHHEEAANEAGLLTPKGRQLVARASAYINLALFLERHSSNEPIAA